MNPSKSALFSASSEEASAETALFSADSQLWKHSLPALFRDFQVMNSQESEKKYFGIGVIQRLISLRRQHGYRFIHLCGMKVIMQQLWLGQKHFSPYFCFDCKRFWRKPTQILIVSKMIKPNVFTFQSPTFSTFCQFNFPFFQLHVKKNRKKDCEYQSVIKCVLLTLEVKIKERAEPRKLSTGSNFSPSTVRVMSRTSTLQICKSKFRWRTRRKSRRLFLANWRTTPCSACI